MDKCPSCGHSDFYCYHDHKRANPFFAFGIAFLCLIFAVLFRIVFIFFIFSYVFVLLAVLTIFLYISINMYFKNHPEIHFVCKYCGWHCVDKIPEIRKK